VRTVGELRDDLARQTLLNAALSRRVPVDRAAEMPQRLVPYQGRLVPIEVPGRSGPVMAMDLTDEEEMPSTGESSGSDVRDLRRGGRSRWRVEAEEGKSWSTPQ